MKKFLSLLLALTLVVSLCPLSVSAANDTTPKVTITKTDIRADEVDKVGEFACVSVGKFDPSNFVPGVMGTVPGLIDRTGKRITDPQKSYYLYFYDPDSEIISFTSETPYRGREYYGRFYGEDAVADIYPIFYNTDGSIAFSLPPHGNTYYDAGPMNNGLAVVLETTKSGGDVKESLYTVDKTGKKVFTIPDAATEPDADGYTYWKKNLENFSDGLAIYSEYNGEYTKLGFMDTTGKLVIDLTDRGYEYNDIYYFHDGLALITKEKDRGFIDKTGKKVISLDDNVYSGFFSHGFAYGRFPTTAADGTATYPTCLFDKTGKIVLRSKYELQLEYSGLVGDGLFTATKDDYYGLINIKDEVIVPFEYDYISTYEDGIAYATKGGYLYIITADEGESETPTAPSFGDVPANAWFAAPVAWAVEKGITNGTGANKFSPDKTCNNAEILTFLWRACGKPEAPAASFTDVASGVWYADAANWAKSKGMVSGDTLSPTQPCTRASAVMYIWQAMGKPAASEAASFTDVPANADYAAAVAWAVEKGVTNGTGADTFSPGTICTRAQIVTFLQRAYA